MLATFTGLLVIRNVSRLLHTPLMSLTNAISAIAVVGSIALAGKMESKFTTVLGAVRCSPR
jgi:NAD(P) transhydrogenase subunit alpha